MSLFKYLPPARADFFETRSLRYSQPAVFNDPFEGKPYYTGMASSDAMEAVYPQRYQKVLREQYLAMSSEFHAKISFALFATELEHTRSSIYDIFRNVDTSFVPSMNEMMHKSFGEKLGVLSLSEINDSQLMWSHYGKSHTGLVIEFDETHGYFTDRKVSADDLWQLHKVTYADRRPHTTIIDFDFEAILLTKHTSWSYEREWKDFRPFNQASEVLQAEPLPIYLFTFPPDSVRSVTFGARMDTNVRAKAIAAIAKHQAWKSLKLFDAFLDDHDYALTFADKRHC